MPSKLVSSQIDDLVMRYLAGEDGPTLAVDFGVTRGTVYRALNRRGIRPRSKSDVMERRGTCTDSHEDEIIKRYRQGESPASMATSFNISADPIYALLRKRGIIRTASESAVLRMAQMTPAQRLALGTAAHNAVRGVPKTQKSLELRALTRQRRGVQIAPNERLLDQWLRDRGVSLTPQLAIGRYNGDLASDAIAVEIFGGGWHAYGEHRGRLFERSRYLLDSGRALHIIWICKEHPLTTAAADDVVAYMKSLSSDPSMRRQYRVIWGDGEFMAAGSGDLYEFALVPPTTGSRRART